MAENYNFLVVDDSPTMRQLITFALKRIHNSQVTEANDGVDALKKLSGNKFSLILLDINMPKMDGVECAKLIRTHTNDNIKNIPIVAITGNAKNYSMDDFRQMGINDYLPKPLNYDDLVETVNKFLRN